MDSRLLRNAKDFQKCLGWSDETMAGFLGCSRQLWQGTRTGKISVGITILRCIARMLPEFSGDILIFLNRGE